MSSNANLLDEYKSLRSEIGRNSQIVSNVFIANIATTGALIGYGLDKDIGVIFLSPLAFLIPSMFFITSQMESTRRIASYIRVFIEPVLDLRWENRWLQLRTHKLLPRRRKYAASLAALYTLLCSICLLLTVRYSEFEGFWLKDSWSFAFGARFFWILLFVIIVVIMTIAGVYNVYNGFSSNLAEEFDDSWTQLRDIENKNK